MAINPIQDKYNALRTIIVNLVETTMGETIWLEGQASQRPPRPYISVGLMKDFELIGGYVYDFIEVDTSGNTTDVLTGQFQYFVEFNIFSNRSDIYNTTLNNAFAIGNAIEIYIRMPEVVAQLNAAGIVYIDSTIVNDTSTILSTTYEPSGNVRLKFNSAIIFPTEFGSIENVDINGMIDEIPVSNNITT